MLGRKQLDGLDDCRQWLCVLIVGNNRQIALKLLCYLYMCIYVYIYIYYLEKMQVHACMLYARAYVYTASFFLPAFFLS
jgi:hypothetical protein